MNGNFSIHTPELFRSFYSTQCCDENTNCCNAYLTVTFIAISTITALGAALLLSTEIPFVVVVLCTGVLGATILAVETVAFCCFACLRSSETEPAPVIIRGTSRRQHRNNRPLPVRRPVEVPSNNTSPRPISIDTILSQPINPQITGQRDRLSTGLDFAHIREFHQIEDSMPEVPNWVQNRHILTIFDRINFENETRDDCFRSSTSFVERYYIVDDDNLTKDRARECLSRLVESKIPNRAVISGMPDGDAARRQWYENYEYYLKNVIYALERIPTDLVYNINPDTGAFEYIPIANVEEGRHTERRQQIARIQKRDHALMRIAASANDHCAGRLMGTIEDIFAEEVLGISGSSIERAIKIALHRYRKGIATQLIEGYIRQLIVSSTFEVHVAVAVFQQLCEPRGIIGRNRIQYYDRYISSAWDLTRERVLTNFDAIYTKDNIHTYMENAINGVLINSTGKRQGEVDIGQIVEWVRTHAPAEWQNRPVANGYANAGEQFLYESGMFEMEEIRYQVQRDERGNIRLDDERNEVLATIESRTRRFNEDDMAPHNANERIKQNILITREGLEFLLSHPNFKVFETT